MSFLIGPFLLRIFIEKHPFLAVFRPIFGNFGPFPLVFGRGRISEQGRFCALFFQTVYNPFRLCRFDPLFLI